MSKSTVNSRRIMDLTMVVLLILSWMFWHKGVKLNQQISTLENEIEAALATTTEINTAMPALINVSDQVLNRVIPNLLPLDHTEEWCENLIEFPHRPDGFQRSFRIGKQKIPADLKQPRILRDKSPYLYPSIIPYQVNVQVSGTVQQTSTFLSEIEQQYPQTMVSKINLICSENSDNLHGEIIFTFPRIQYAEDITKIRDLTEIAKKQASDSF